MKQQTTQKNDKKISLFIIVITFFLLPIISAYALSYDSMKNSIDMNYDENNRVVNQTGSSDWIKYVYDEDMNNTLTNVSNEDVLISYEYDNKKRVIKEIKTIDGISFEKEINYDAKDRIISINFLSSLINYTYNNQNILGSILNILNINYNEQNQPINKSYNNNLQTNFSYNDTNFRLAEIKTDTKQELDYTYDDFGNIIEINDSVNARNLSMQYDDLHRLIYTNINTQEFNFFYNAIGNILNITINDTNITYGYDSLTHAPDWILYGADLPPNTTLISPANNSVDEDGTIIFNCSATDDNNLANITLYGNWGGGWHANETQKYKWDF